MTKRAVILLSGGLDSVTALAIAKAEGYECFTISFDYGQRHKTELFAAENLAKKSGVASHKVIQIDLRAIGGSALTDDIDVPETEQQGIPITYVPARNTVFLSIALGWAEVLNAEAIFVGVNAVDYIKAPLMHLSKSEIVKRGTELGIDYSETVSCYQADAQGRACGQCDSCRFRRQGFIDAGLADPTRYQ